NKIVFTMIVKSNNIIKLKTDLNNYLINELKKLNQIDSSNEATQKELIANQVKQITTPWMMFFLKYDPAKALEKTNCAVLALNGSNDLQVSPKQNLVAISNSLKKGGNNNFTIKELPKLNHLFQESKTGSPTEYSTIEQTFSPIALEEILSWIKTQVK
ncbi:MAG: alpha/beta hydrolase, partial [Candidatus Kapaibacterium sp.]